MRIDIVIDGEISERVTLTCRPSAGEVIQTDKDVLEIKEVRHDIARNRLSAWCSKRTPMPTDRPLSREKNRPEPSKQDRIHQ